MVGTREISINIASHSEEHPKISVNALISNFQAIQNLMYVICDHLEGHKPRAAGDFPKTVKDNCELEISELKQGSVDATVRLSHNQYGLPGAGGTFGERAISIAGTIIDIASSQDEIYPKVLSILNNDEDRAVKSIEVVDNLWPEQDSIYDVNIGFGSAEKVKLDPQRKPIIKNAIIKSPKPIKKTVTGRLVELSVDKKRQFIIDTPEGKYTCKYPPELEGIVIKRIKQLVSVSGSTEEGQRTINIANEKEFKPLKNLPLTHIRFDESHVLSLRVPINLEVEFENDEYILYNDDFSLLVTCNDLKDGVDRINGEFKLLWFDYVEEDVSKLTEGGVQFREKLLSLPAEGI